MENEEQKPNSNTRGTPTTHPFFDGAVKNMPITMLNCNVFNILLVFGAGKEYLKKNMRFAF